MSIRIEKKKEQNTLRQNVKMNSPLHLSFASIDYTIFGIKGRKQICGLVFPLKYRQISAFQWVRLWQEKRKIIKQFFVRSEPINGRKRLAKNSKNLIKYSTSLFLSHSPSLSVSVALALVFSDERIFRKNISGIITKVRYRLHSIHWCMWPLSFGRSIQYSAAQCNPISE